MSVKVAGFNMFKQWLISDFTITSFTRVSLYELTIADDFEVLLLTWSYNIFRSNNEIFIAGLYTNRDTHLYKIDLPNDVFGDAKKLVFSGNDRYVLLSDSVKRRLWKCVFGRNPLWNWNPISAFWQVESNNPTTSTQDENIVSIGVNCTMNLCLSTTGLIYDIPQKIDVSHCIGKVIDFQCGNEHAIAVTDGGYVYTWGSGRRCQLGHGELINDESPRLVEALAGVRVVLVRAGGWHCAALGEAGELYVWGWNDSGQLGVKATATGASQYKKPKTSNTSVPSLALPTLVHLYESASSDSELNYDVIDVACGSKHTVLVLKDNSIWATGSNLYGQLGAKLDLEKYMHFQKVHQGDTQCNVKCGPWTTVINSKI